MILLSVILTQGIIAQISGKVAIIGCEALEDEDKQICSYQKMGKLLEEHLSSNGIKELIDGCESKEEIKLSIGFVLDQNKKIVPEMFSVGKKNDVVKKEVLQILQDHLRFRMPVNECGMPVISIFEGVSLRFSVQNESDVFKISLLDFVEKEDVMSNLDMAPIHRNCRKATNNKELKKCLSYEMKKFVNRKFKVHKAEDDLACTTRTVVSFRVNKEGEIDCIKVLSEDKGIEKEAIRVVRSFPKVTPGHHNGKTVGVLYSLPIVIGPVR